MIRYVAVLKRRPGTSREEFLTAWLGEHRALASALPHVLRVEFQPSVALDAGEPEFDGVGVLEYASLGLLRESLASDRARALRAHTSTFADSDATVRAVVTVPSPDDMAPPESEASTP